MSKRSDPPIRVLPDRPPIRVQRLRTPGWRMPETAVYVGRPTRWGNPFRIGPEDDWPDFLTLYRSRLVALAPAELDDFLAPLRGFDLCCWCPLVNAQGVPHPCHADVLLELANREVTDG